MCMHSNEVRLFLAKTFLLILLLIYSPDIAVAVVKALTSLNMMRLAKIRNHLPKDEQNATAVNFIYIY